MSCTIQAPPPATAVKRPPRKKLQQRRVLDRSQQIRRGTQLLFLAFNIWIGVEFYLFVRYYESGGQGWKVERPPGVEGYLPIASLMNLKAWLATGEFPMHHAAGMFLLMSFLAMSLLLRKAFCSWLCPVGTISEGLWKTGRQTFGKNWHVPRRLDPALRGLKYILLGLFLYAVGSMSAASIRAFLDGPYGVIADVKMMNFFRYLGTTAAVVLGLLVLLSIFIQNFWCRYLCPYGALFGLVSRFSPVRVRRDPALCIDCGKCTVQCSSLLPVDKLITVRSPECTGCYECVTACPAAGALEMTVAGKRRAPAWTMAAALAVVFLGFVSYAMWSGHWHTYLPEEVYLRLIPRAGEFTHP
jgi:polyferredoxin